MQVTIQNPFDSNSTITMDAHYEPTRNGFRHLASTDDGVNAKCCYLNRTWEVYTFQSVLFTLAWNWIIANTGWNPKTKRDGAAFQSVYKKMKREIDKKCGY